MKKFILLVFLFSVTISYINAQNLDLFSPMEGVPTCQTAEPERDFIAVMTAYTSDGQINFDFDEFQSTIWIYIMRSKTEPYTIASYGVFSMLGQFSAMPTEIEEDTTMANMMKLDFDAMVYKDKNVTEKLKLNPDFLTFMASNPTLSEVIAILMKTNEIDLGIAFPASFKGTETWAFNFSGQMICLVNAMNGETFCSEVVSPVNETPDDSQLAVYPNPATEIININLENASSDVANIKIFDAYGRELISRSTRDSHLSLPVSDLSAGTYIIEVNANGKVIRNKFNKL